MKHGKLKIDGFNAMTNVVFMQTNGTEKANQRNKVKEIERESVNFCL